jgi:predicted kinase
VPFDAIEFDPLIATGDILYELAFLLMDLVERALPAAANVVFNRYLAQTRRDADLDGLAALPLFLSIRAAVRAMVTAARASRAEEDRKAMIASAQRYFEWALTFIAPPRPVLIAVGGLSGTGKSLLARAVAPDFAPAPGAVVLRSDVERKILFGKGETERLPNDAYMPDVTARVYASLNAKARRALVAGHSVVVDAVFARDAERAAVSGVARACGADFRGLFLTTDLLTRLARVGTRVADASDADAMVVRKQESYEVGALDWEQIDASGTPDATLARARAALR